MFRYFAITQTWSQLHKLLPSGGAAAASFGQFLALQDNIVLGGSYYDNSMGTDAGNYLFVPYCSYLYLVFVL